MRVLAINPFHTGSHRAFLEGWIARSRHDWTTLTLPGRHWKWRMRSAAWDCAHLCSEHPELARGWDVLVTTDMLALDSFRGLAPREVAELPALVYFHENQLTYPSRANQEQRERDLHFGVTNIASALCADALWFNSAYNRDSFFHAATDLLDRMPALQNPLALTEARGRSHVQPPGIEIPSMSGPRERAPRLRIGWAHRWEYDKGPDLFAAAIDALKAANIDFELCVLGEQFAETPSAMQWVQTHHADLLVHCGFAPSRDEYFRLLASCDVFLSTARHEFFGLSTVEAVASGCFPLVPDALAYPEVLADLSACTSVPFVHEGTPAGIARAIDAVRCAVEAGSLWSDSSARGVPAIERFSWSTRAPQMDDALAHICSATEAPA